MRDTGLELYWTPRRQQVEPGFAFNETDLPARLGISSSLVYWAGHKDLVGENSTNIVCQRINACLLHAPTQLSRPSASPQRLVVGISIINTIFRKPETISGTERKVVLPWEVHMASQPLQTLLIPVKPLNASFKSSIEYNNANLIALNGPHVIASCPPRHVKAPDQ